MPVESAQYIHQLNANYPEGDDPRSEGDDHFHVIKASILNTFPNIKGPVTLTHTQLNAAIYDKATLAKTLGVPVVTAGDNVKNSVLSSTSDISLGISRGGRLLFRAGSNNFGQGLISEGDFTEPWRLAGQNGYQIFPMGFRLYWGTFTLNHAANDVQQFVVDYPEGVQMNNPLHAMVQPVSGLNGSITCTVESIGARGISGFCYNPGGAANRTYRYLAWGF